MNTGHRPTPCSTPLGRRTVCSCRRRAAARFTAAVPGLTGADFPAIAPRALPFALVMVGVSALIGFVPSISLFALPN